MGSALNGGNFFDGALNGAKWGAIAAGAHSGIEASGNALGGHGFRLNEGVIKNYIKEGEFQSAIDFVQSKYKLSGPSMTYDRFESAYGSTNPTTGNILIGPAAFGSPDLLKATIIHEYAHSTIGRRIADGKWGWIHDPVSSSDYGDGIIGYSQEIKQAGRMHINRGVLSKTVPTIEDWTYARGMTKYIKRSPINPVWHSRGLIKNKWWHLLPRRY